MSDSSDIAILLPEEYKKSQIIMHYFHPTVVVQMLHFLTSDMFGAGLNPH